MSEKLKFSVETSSLALLKKTKKKKTCIPIKGEITRIETSCKSMFLKASAGESLYLCDTLSEMIIK